MSSGALTPGGSDRRYETLIVERRGAADWVTLNRPHVINALNAAMIGELQDYFAGLEADTERRVVVLRGAGNGFCSGHDMKGDGLDQIAAERGDVALALENQRRLATIIQSMRRCPQPIVALVHGAASGGGFALALAADLRIAGQSARMNCAFIKVGLSGCDLGTSYFLPRIVGAAVASELILTGRFIEADRAVSLGLVCEAVADDRLEEAAGPYVEAMLATSPLGLRLSKECLNYALDAPSIHAAMAMEDRNQVLCAQSEDFLEGARAFLDRRPPKFTG